MVSSQDYAFFYIFSRVVLLKVISVNRDFYDSQIVRARGGSRDALDYIYKHFDLYNEFKDFIAKRAENLQDSEAIEIVFKNFKKYQDEICEPYGTPRNTTFNKCIVQLAKKCENKDALQIVLENRDDLTFARYIRELGVEADDELAKKIVLEECEKVLKEIHNSGFTQLQWIYINALARLAKDENEKALEIILDIENYKQTDFYIITGCSEAKNVILSLAKNNNVKAKDIIYNVVEYFCNIQKNSHVYSPKKNFDRFSVVIKDFGIFVVNAAIDDDENAINLVCRNFDELLAKDPLKSYLIKERGVFEKLKKCFFRNAKKENEEVIRLIIKQISYYEKTDCLFQKNSVFESHYISIYTDCIRNLALQGNSECLNYLYSNAGKLSYSKTLIELAELDDQRAIDEILKYPDVYTDFINKIALQENSKAIESICRYCDITNFSNTLVKLAKLGISRATDEILNRPNCFVDFIKEIALQGNLKAIDSICKNSDITIFSSTLVELAKLGNPKAANEILKHPDFFIDFIREMALQGDSEAVEALCDNADDACFSDTLIKLAEQGCSRAKEEMLKRSNSFANVIKELALQGDSEAVEALCDNADDACFSDTLIKLAEQGCSRAKEEMLKRPNRFLENIFLWAKQGSNEAMRIIEQNGNNVEFAKYIINMAKQDDAQAKKIIKDSTANAKTLLKLSERNSFCRRTLDEHPEYAIYLKFLESGQA